MLGKLLIDDQLMYMGCNITYICSLCRSNSEALKHIFFSSIYAGRLWIWFCQNINDDHYPTNLEDLWKIDNCSPKSSIVIDSGIVYIINDIWNAMSAFRFMNKSYTVSSIIASIKTKMSRTGNNTNLCATTFMDDFFMLKAFDFSLQPPRAPFYQRDHLATSSLRLTQI